MKLCGFSLTARRLFLAAIALASAFTGPTVQATVVRMNYTIGGEAYGSADFRMFDSAMPVSVANL